MFKIILLHLMNERYNKGTYFCKTLKIININPSKRSSFKH